MLLVKQILGKYDLYTYSCFQSFGGQAVIKFRAPCSHNTSCGTKHKPEQGLQLLATVKGRRTFKRSLSLIYFLCIRNVV